MNKIITFTFFCVLLQGCSSEDNDKDMEYPTIMMSDIDAFPTNCTTLYKGESFSFKATFSDNQELGSYNIEIHNNFDHHTHSTDGIECELEPEMKPINPFIYNQDFSIPDGTSIFEAENTISIPDDIDSGDYHFMIRLTDKAGWQQLKSVSLKIKDIN